MKAGAFLVGERRHGDRARRKRAEDIADAIDLHIEIEFSHPCNDLIATGLLGIGEGDAGASASDGVGADLAQFAQLSQQNRAIQMEDSRGFRFGHESVVLAGISGRASNVATFEGCR
ncbi:hypothetical protein PHO31112_02312 [Pandoraea horticolens]|uniref:Uncharacterized protein n=1 Tax=Pandoraea horticolens TaxID=2508298 RepID=A0A5E4UYW9_9BURK|nr:hypothetical protein PHO31112_02312 [Pandoraea horticolens]